MHITGMEYELSFLSASDALARQGYSLEALFRNLKYNSTTTIWCVISHKKLPIKHIDSWGH